MESQFYAMRRQLMPPPAELARRAQLMLPDKLGIEPYGSEYLRRHFDEILLSLLDLEYQLFLTEQERVNEELLAKLFADRLETVGAINAETAAAALATEFNTLNEFFSSLAQSRKTRAGGSFERHVDFLLATLGYPFEKQVVINGKPDFLFPNATLYRTRPTDLILFTAKRTLRERWRQIIIEGMRTPYYFLGTIDRGLSDATINEMVPYRVILVMPRQIIHETPRYQAHANIIDYDSFFRDYLDPARVRWAAAGLV